MPYNYTLILRFPEQSKEQAAVLREAVRKLGEQDPSGHALAAAHEDLREFASLEQDLGPLMRTVSKKFGRLHDGFGVARPNFQTGRVDMQRFATRDDALEAGFDDEQIQELTKEDPSLQVESMDVFAGGQPDSREALENALQRLLQPNRTGRLMIFGHGTVRGGKGGWRTVRVGGHTPLGLAQFLAGAGLSGKGEAPIAKPDRISLVACYAGREFENGADAGPPLSRSYAEEFHLHLAEHNRIRTVVSARLGGLKVRGLKGGGYGKFVDVNDTDLNGGTPRYKRQLKGTKIVWRWHQGKQDALDPRADMMPEARDN